VKDFMMAILQIAQAKDVHGHVKSKAWTTSFIFNFFFPPKGENFQTNYNLLILDGHGSHVF